MKQFVVTLAIALLILHQDIWFWKDTSLVLGFIPVGLFYHACFSISVALLGLLAIKYLWPHDLERWAKGEDVKTNLKEKEYQIR